MAKPRRLRAARTSRSRAVRNSLYGNDPRAEALVRLARGTSVEGVARAVGVDPEDVLEWLDTPSFAQELQRLKALTAEAREKVYTEGKAPAPRGRQKVKLDEVMLAALGALGFDTHVARLSSGEVDEQDPHAIYLSGILSTLDEVETRALGELTLRQRENIDYRTRQSMKGLSTPSNIAAEAFVAAQLAEEETGKKKERVSAKELKEQKTAAIRGGKVDAHGHVISGRSLESLSPVSQQGKEYTRQATFFIEEDPPRVAKDKASFCGNPLDGTAYYLAISNATKSLSFWVNASGRKAGETIDAYLKRVERETGVKPTPRAQEGFGQITRMRKEQGVSAGHLVKRQSGIAQRIPGQGIPMQDMEVDLKSDLLVANLVGGKFVDLPPQRDHSQRVYIFRVDQGKKAFAKERLNEFFQPFQPQSILVTSENEILESLLARELSIPLVLARMYITSGAVSIDWRDGEKSLKQPLLNPTVPVKVGATVKVSFGDKDTNPYFAWVTSRMPTWKPGSQKPDFICATEEEEELLKILRSTRGALGAFVGQMQSIQKQMDLIGQGAVPSPFDFSVFRLSKGLASLMNWWRALAKGELAMSVIVPRMREVQAVSLGRSVALLAEAGIRLGLVRDDQGRFWSLQFAEGTDYLEEIRQRARSHMGPWGPLFGFLTRLGQGELTDPLVGFLPPGTMGSQLDDLRSALPLGEPDVELPPWAVGEDAFLRYLEWCEHLITQANRPDRDEALVAIHIVRMLEPVIRQRDLLNPAHVPDQPAVDSRGRRLHRGPTPEKEVAALRARVDQAVELTTRAYLYVALQGPALIGPMLMAREPGPMTRFVARLQEEVIELQGGSGLHEVGRLTIYKTYNPILYEITRLYWPESKTQVWRGYNSRPDLMVDVDTAGRYGVALEVVSTAAVKAATKEQLQEILLQEAGGVAQELAASDKPVVAAVKGKGKYEKLKLLWPLGEGWRVAVEQLRDLATDFPVALDALKLAYSKALSKTGAYTKRGVPSTLMRSPRPMDAAPSHDGQAPYLDPGVPPLHVEQEEALGRISGALERVLNIEGEGLAANRAKYKAAVKQFQARQGLHPSGLLDAITVNALAAADRRRPTEDAYHWGKREFDMDKGGHPRPASSSIAHLRAASSSYEDNMKRIKEAKRALDAQLKHLRSSL